MQRFWTFLALVGVALWWLVLFGRLWILDKPGPDVPKRPRVPTFQGIFMMLLIVITSYVYLPESVSFAVGTPFAGMLWWLVLIIVVNVIDEVGRNVNKKYRIPAWIRLLIQAMAGVLAYAMSGVGIHSLVLPWWEIPLSTFSQIVFTVARFWLFCNAINWFDGIYGLATGTSTLGFGMIALLVQFVVLASFAVVTVARETLLHEVVVVSAICAMVWLIYTVIEYKPWGLVRDVGTMGAWFVLAYLALLGGAKIGMMLVVLALPLFDSVRVIINRLKEGKNPLKGDYTHLHYRLMALWRNRHEARATIWWWSIGIAIIMLLQWTNRMDKLIIFVLMAVFFFGINMYLFWFKKLPSSYDPQKHLSKL